MIRLLTGTEPAVPPIDRACIFVSSDTLTAQIKDDEGNIQYLSGITGLVNVYKIVEDGSAEAPGNGLPSEQAGVRYLIRTNTTIGSLHSGWGVIPNLQPNDLIQRSNDNSKWVIVRPAANGAGQILIYDSFTNLVNKFDNTSWKPLSANNIQSINTSTGLILNKLHMIDNSGGALTLVLPSAIGHSGETIRIKCVTNNSNTVTVNTTSGQTIDGAGSDVFSIGYFSAEYVAHAGNWFKI
jgi:hypothetical protein